MRRAKVLAFLGAPALALAVTACVTVRLDGSPEPAWPPPQTARPKSMALLVAGSGSLNENSEVLGSVFENWRAQTERAYRESGLFSEVAFGLADADFQATVRIQARTRRNQPWFALASLTICTIPAVFTTELTVDTTVSQRNLNLGSLTASAKTRSYVHPLLIVLSPIWEQESIMSQVVYELNRFAIGEAHSRGWFS